MFAKLWKPYTIRNFSKSTVWKNVGKPKTVETTPPKESTRVEGSINLETGAVPKEWEKKLLVWSGKYKSVEDVPKRISYDSMGKMKSEIRIKMANYMMVATVLACIGVAYLGKMAAKRGDSINKRVLEQEEAIIRKYKNQ